MIFTEMMKRQDGDENERRKANSRQPVAKVES